MEIAMASRRSVIALAIASLAAVMSAVTAYAAMEATLSSDHARAGDWVLILTDDNNGRANYGDLSAEGKQPIYLAPVTDDPTVGCGGAGSNMVGRLAWRGNRGGVAFRVPSLPLGSYYLFMDTHAQCWRIGGTLADTHGPLVLTIGTVAAENQDVAMNWSVESLGPPQHPRSQASVPLPLSPIIAGGILVAALLAASAMLWRRRRLSR
jgi:hypothetical protein